MWGTNLVLILYALLGIHFLDDRVQELSQRRHWLPILLVYRGEVVWGYVP